MENTTGPASLNSGTHSLLRRPLFLSILLVLLTGAIFLPVINFDFVVFDDPEYITQNATVQSGLSVSNVVWSFGAHAANWHPLTWMSHMLDCEIFGVKAGGHHATNLILHLANTVLLFGLLRLITGATLRSAFVAAVFALHPMHVESVAWVAERKDVLSTFFALLTLHAYVRFAREGSKRIYYGLALLFFVLALMSKPMVVTIPFLLLLLDYWPLKRFADASGRGRNIRNLILEKLPFFVLSAAGCGFTIWAHKEGGAVATLTHVSFSDRLANALTSYSRYLGKTFWPMDLAIPYPYRMDIPWWEIFGSLLVLAGISYGAITMLRSRPYIAMGWCWFLGMLVPVIGLVQVGNQSMADRYMYLPMIGPLMALAWGVGDAIERWRFRGIALSSLAIAVLGFLGVGTVLQLRYWRSTEALFTHSLQVTPDNFIAHNYYGVALALEGRYQEATAHYEKALRENPHFADGHNNLGYTLAQLGRLDEAIKVLNRAIELKPGHVQAHNNLASVLAKQGKYAEAAEHFRVAVASGKDVAVSEYNLAAALTGQGKHEEAAIHFAEVVKLKPDDLEARLNLGIALAKAGKIDDAIAEFESASKRSPKDPQFRYYLGLAESAKGNPERAIKHYREAIRLKPDFAFALNDLAWLFATHPVAEIRNGSEAIALAEEACRISNWKEAPFLGTLDAAYAENGEFSKAIVAAEKTISAAKSQGREDIADFAQSRLELYRRGIPYHQTASSK